MLTSARRGILYPNPLRGDSADVPRDIGAVIAALEADVIYGQGTLAARPTSSGGSPGIQGRVYMATDQTPHAFYYDFGTGWDAIGSLAAGSVGTTQLADGSVTGGAAGAGVKIAALTITHDNIVAGTIRTNEILDGTILPADLAPASFYPTSGLANGSEGMRAIGSGGSQVVAGNDARLTDVRAPSVGHDPSAYGTAFPTTGLFNGYRFTFFHTDVTGTVPADYIYRADLDATHPWHNEDSKELLAVNAADFAFNTVAAAWQDLSTPTVARAGDYVFKMSWTGGTNDTDAGGPASFIRMTIGSYTGNARKVVANFGSNGRAPDGGQEVRYVASISAAATVHLQGQVQFASNGTVEGLSLVVIPVRVI